MGHEISITADGRAEAMFAYEKPWHGLGITVNQNVTASEALRLTHLDWYVRKEPIYRTNIEQIPDHVAVCRADTRAYLATVRRSYTLVQNEAVANLTDALCSFGNVYVDSAAALRGGRLIFFCVRMPNDIVVGPNDSVQRYLLVLSSHDSKCSLRILYAPCRTVCMNTLNAALARGERGISLRHTRNIHTRLDQIKRTISEAEGYYTRLGERFTKLRHASLDDDGYERFLDEVFTGPDGEPSPPQMATARGIVLRNWHQGRGVELGGKSFWNAYNSVTEFTSHAAPLRGNRVGARFQNIFLGSGSHLQQKAFDTALEMIGANRKQNA